MKTLKKGCKVLMLVLAMLVVLGCKDAYAYASSTETVIKMGEDEKAGTLVTKIGFAKNYYKNSEYSAVESVEEFVQLLESCVNEELGLKFAVDTTDSVVDYLTVTVEFKDMEDLNKKIDAIYYETDKLHEIKKMETVHSTIYTACFESKKYSEELAKLIQQDGYACSADDEWIQILTYRMLTGQNVKTMADIEVSLGEIKSLEFEEVEVVRFTGLGFEKTDYGYTVFAAIIDMLTNYIDEVVQNNIDLFYHDLEKVESKLYPEVDKVVYEQFVDKYKNNINFPRVMESCFPGVTDMSEVDTNLLLSKLEVTDLKQEDSIYDMYASKLDVDMLYGYAYMSCNTPISLIGLDNETKFHDFKLYVGDTLYIDSDFYDKEWYSDALFLIDESTDMSKEEIKDAIMKDIKAEGKTEDLDDTPDTGDGISLYILLGIAMLATVGIAITFSINKRRMYV